ncbi:hypothetical protein [Streptomyces sp. NPDC055140]
MEDVEATDITVMRERGALPAFMRSRIIRPRTASTAAQRRRPAGPHASGFYNDH